MYLGCDFATIPYLKFMLLGMLFPMLNILHFYSNIRTVFSVCTVSHVAVFCSVLMSCFPGMLVRHFLNDSEIAPFTSIEIGITFVFTLLLLLLLLLLHVCTNYTSFFLASSASSLTFPISTKPKSNTSQSLKRFLVGLNLFS